MIALWSVEPHIEPSAFGTGQQRTKAHFCEVHCDKLLRIQMGFVWPSETVPCVNQDLSQCSIKRFLPWPLHFLISFLVALWLLCVVARPHSLSLSSFHRCCGRAWPWAWLQNRNHVVSNGRVFVQRIVEVPILLVDELVDFFPSEGDQRT